MPYNGAGSYSPPAASFPAVTLTTIQSTKYNSVINDIASALSTAICKDGQTTVAADLPMNSKKFTGLAAGSGAGDSLRYEQLFVNSVVTLLGGLVVGSVSGVLQFPDGTVGAPGLRVGTSSSTGIFSSADNTLRFACAGAEGARVIGTGLYVTGGGVTFPATQVASVDPNTLDDYEEGTWTPALSFAVPGNLVVAYSVQGGYYTKVGNIVHITMDLDTSTFTHTTASGVLQILNLPFTSAAPANQTHSGCGAVGGITKAGYTDFYMRLAPSSSVAIFGASGSGVVASNVLAADMPTGGIVQLRQSMTYRT